MQRRSFLLVVAKLIAFTWLCACQQNGRKRVSRKIALGDPSIFSAGVTVLSVKRVAVVKDDQGFAVMAAVCTHMTCALQKATSGLRCPCHGSRFSLDGSVENGPAKKPLTFYHTFVEDGVLYADLAKEVSAAERLSL